ncbi:MAG: DUF1624 domain-containing protein [Flavisolibacter sp.]
MPNTSTATPIFIKGMPKPVGSYRVESIDLLRGLIMIIMAIDHVRDYFHAAAFTDDPLNLQTTTPILFFTRWVTHYCAPLFVFLSGISASLVGQRKGKQYLTRFLITRGLWLVFLELTVVCFAWFFNPTFTTQLLGVIWALGWSMVFLAGFIHLPKWVTITIGLALVFGHNLLDGVHVSSPLAASLGWSVVHQFNFFKIGSLNVLVGYPLIPWIGVMALGYCLGSIYKKDGNTAKRKRLLMYLGIASILLFIIIRYSNLYGDPSQWKEQRSALYTFFSFLKVTKYPPSLLYLLMTIGPGLVFLSLTENINGLIPQGIKTIGRVPMFYYLVHLYLIHIGSLIAAVLSGRPWSDMVSFSTWISLEPKLHGYGFSLGVVYAVWASLIVILYFLCKWYDGYKSAHRDKWWLSYL